MVFRSFARAFAAPNHSGSTNCDNQTSASKQQETSLFEVALEIKEDDGKVIHGCSILSHAWIRILNCLRTYRAVSASFRGTKDILSCVATCKNILY